MVNSNIPEPCASCGGKCCNRFAVPITHFDVLRLQKHTGKRPEEICMLEDAQLISKNPYPKVFVLEEDAAQAGRGKLPERLVEKLLVLRRTKTDNCVFFGKSNGCSVHVARPAVCRTYPFSLYADFAKDKKIGSKRLERLIGSLVGQAKNVDISGTKASGDVFYTMNVACPRRWETGEFSVGEVMADLVIQEAQVARYWKVANEWNAKVRKEVEPSFGNFLAFALEKAEIDAQEFSWL